MSSSAAPQSTATAQGLCASHFDSDLFPHGNLSAKGIDINNAKLPVSNMRTPLPLLPFPHPKWHVHPTTHHIYEVTSPIFDEYDPVNGYIGSVGEVRQSIESGEEDVIRLDGEASGDWRDDWSGTAWRWCGEVKHPESRERSSLQREAKRLREERKECGEARVHRAKRMRGRH